MPTGDLNGDGIVNAVDLSILVSRWGTNDPIANLSGSGIVGANDLSILVSNWGAESAPIPDDEVLAIIGVSASTEDGSHVASNVIDGDLNTRWSGEGWGASLMIDLGQVMPVGAIEIAWFNGDQRRWLFDIHVSNDGASWSPHFLGAYSSGATLDYERYDVNNTETRYVRVFGLGNDLNMWNSITGIRVRSHTATELSGMAPLILSFDGAVVGTNIALQWTKTSQTSGTLERATSASGPWEELNSLNWVNKPFDSRTDGSALADTEYWYRLTVVNGFGDDTAVAGPIYMPPAPNDPDPPLAVSHGSELQDVMTGLEGAGVDLSSLSSSGGLTTTYDGQVIEYLNIRDTPGAHNPVVVIEHSNVTIRYCRIRHPGQANGVRIVAGLSGVLIEYCDFDGELNEWIADTGSIAIDNRGGATVRRNFLRRYRAGMHNRNGDILVQENYLAGNFNAATSGFGKGAGIAYRGGSAGGVTIERNYINLTGSRSGGINMYASFGPIHDVNVRDNLIIGHGGGFGTYGGDSNVYKAHNQAIRYTGNRFDGFFRYPNVLGEGTNAAVNMNRPGAVWTNNRWLGSSTDLPPRCGTKQDACH